MTYTVQFDIDKRNKAVLKLFRDAATKSASHPTGDRQGAQKVFSSKILQIHVDFGEVKKIFAPLQAAIASVANAASKASSKIMRRTPPSEFLTDFVSHGTVKATDQAGTYVLERSGALYVSAGELDALAKEVRTPPDDPKHPLPPIREIRFSNDDKKWTVFTGSSHSGSTIMARHVSATVSLM